jgi:hypothetical protein
MSSVDGPFGPGFRRRAEKEKNRRYFRSTNAWWNLSRVAGFDEHATLLDPAGAHEQRGEPEDQAIERGEIRGALSAAVTDQKLMFEK